MSRDKKISDKEFFGILRENAGLYARTARAIRNQFDMHSIMRSKNERLRLEACKFQIKRRENVYDDKAPTSFEVTIIEGKNNK